MCIVFHFANVVANTANARQSGWTKIKRNVHAVSLRSPGMAIVGVLSLIIQFMVDPLSSVPNWDLCMSSIMARSRVIVVDDYSPAVTNALLPMP